MNSLYGTGNDGTQAYLEFSDDILRRALLNIYAKDFHPATDIEAVLFNAVWDKLNKAVRRGYASTRVIADTDRDFLNELQRNNGVFAAFKVHRMQNDMAHLLIDVDGNLKPFERWLNDVRPIASHQVGAWLRTEYDTAVLRAHQAADWRQFERESDVLPNLKWKPSTSPNPGLDHRIYWNTVRPINDQFWNEHRPGDRWNCKCDLTATDEPVTPIPHATSGGCVDAQKGLANNPAKDGRIFSDDHPYFPSDCSHCDFYKPSLKDRLSHIFTNRAKDCYNCPYIAGCIDRAAEIKRVSQEMIAERKRVVASGIMQYSQDHDMFKNIFSGDLLRSKKAMGRLVKHCYTTDELNAAVYMWNNPDKLVFVRNSPLGEGKDMSSLKAQKNINKKRERGIVTYNIYELRFDNTSWIVKFEVHEKGFEMPYFIREQ